MRLSAAGQALVLLAAPLVPASISAWYHPYRPDWEAARHPITTFTLAEAERLDPPVLWIDARETAEFDRDHIPGALNLNETQWEQQLPALIARWEPGRPVVVYCGSGSCQTSRVVAKRLRDELGFDAVGTLVDGWTAWKKKSEARSEH